jgi:hypothetical protein
MDESTINTTTITGAIIEPNNEVINVTDDALYPTMTDVEFSDAVTKQLQRIESYESKIKLKKRQSVNKMYYEGDQLDLSSLRDDQEKWVENAILRNLETLIPILTSQVPELSTTPAYKNERTRDFASDVRRVMQTEWETYQGMQSKVSKGIRNHQKNLLAVFQLGYDPETDTFWTEEIPATELKISKHKDMLIRYIKNKDLGYLLDTFANKKTEILQYYGLKDNVDITKKMRSSPVEFIEVWTNEVVGWRLGPNLVLEVDRNPHWDEEGKEYESTSVDGQPVTAKVYFNHLKKRKMPFLFISHINTTGHAYDDTTLLEQAIGLQNWINKRKRQIGENADAANGVWVTSGDFISQEEFEKIEGGINEKIWLENGLPANGIARITGNSLEDFVYNDLIDSRNALNELMGINAATLGTKTNNNTLGKDLMDRQQNVGRAGGYERDGIEKFSQEWYEYMYHLYLVYKTDETSLAIPETDDIETDNIILSRANVPVIQKKNGDMIPVPLVLSVKTGSTLPKDEVMDYKRAQDNKDLYAPIDYFKKIGEANPRQLAKNAVINAMDPTWFFKDDPDVIQIQQAQMQKQQMLAAQANPQQNIPPVDQRQPALPSGDGGGSGSTSKGVAHAVRALLQEKKALPSGMQNATMS